MTTIPVETIPEPNRHTEEVRNRINAIRGITETIPGFAQGRLVNRRKMNYSANVTDATLEKIAAAIEAANPGSADARAAAVVIRDAIAFTQAYQSLAGDMEVQLDAVLFTIAKTRSDAAKLALKSYKMARMFEDPSDRAVPVPHTAHIDEIKRLLRRRRPQPKAPADPQPAPPAAPPVKPGGAS